MTLDRFLEVYVNRAYYADIQIFHDAATPKNYAYYTYNDEDKWLTPEGDSIPEELLERVVATAVTRIERTEMLYDEHDRSHVTHTYCLDIILE